MVRVSGCAHHDPASSAPRCATARLGAASTGRIELAMSFGWRDATRSERMRAMSTVVNVPAVTRSLVHLEVELRQEREIYAVGAVSRQLAGLSWLVSLAGAVANWAG